MPRSADFQLITWQRKGTCAARAPDAACSSTAAYPIHLCGFSCADSDEECAFSSTTLPALRRSTRQKDGRRAVFKCLSTHRERRNSIPAGIQWQKDTCGSADGQFKDALVSNLQAQYDACKQAYQKIKQLRARVAHARSNGSYKKASQLLHKTNSSSSCSRGIHLQKHHQRLHLATEHAAADHPSLPALAVVVRMLLQLAATQAGSAAAAALRHQLLLDVRSRALQSGRHGSVAQALHQALPGLRTAVQQACCQARQAPSAPQTATTAGAAAAKEPGGDWPAGTGCPIRDAAAAVEAALMAAACQVQLEFLAISAAEAVADGSSDSSCCAMQLDMDALLREEMAAALSEMV